MDRDRRSVAVIVGIVLMVLLFTALPLAIIVGITTSNSCAPSVVTVRNGGVKLGTGPAVDNYFNTVSNPEERKAIAAIIIEEGRKLKLTDRSIAIGLGVAIQESGLRNLPYGDRDSLGVFQQRPSIIDQKTGLPYWGTAEQIMDPHYSANRFFKELIKDVQNRDELPMVEVGIIVQNPNKEAYRRNWQWDQIVTEMVSGSGGCQSNGNAALPVEPGYSISAEFDDANYTGAAKPHKGIDFSGYADGSIGHPVFAARGGVVITSGQGNSCTRSNNNTVTILHDDGTTTGYLHMLGSSITVAKGDTVQSGQQIGTIASCGQSTGAHLHFETGPGTNKEPWVLSLYTVQKYGQPWTDPVGYMNHFGVNLIP